MRWRYGDTYPVVLPVDSATVIEIGDLVYLDTDDAKPAVGQADQGSRSRQPGIVSRQVRRRGHAAVAQRRHAADPRGDDRRVRVRLRCRPRSKSAT